MIGTIVASYSRMFIVVVNNSLTNVFIPFSSSSSLSNGFHNQWCTSCMLISSLSRSLPFFVCCSDIYNRDIIIIIDVFVLFLIQCLQSQWTDTTGAERLKGSIVRINYSCCFHDVLLPPCLVFKIAGSRYCKFNIIQEREYWVLLEEKKIWNDYESFLVRSFSFLFVEEYYSRNVTWKSFLFLPSYSKLD